MTGKKIVFSVLALLLCVPLVLTGCKSEPTPQDFTVTVKSAGGAALSDIGIFIYADRSLSDLVWADETDDGGMTEFSAESDTTYFASLRYVPTGYKSEEIYEIKEAESEITLETALLSEESLSDTSLELGSVFCDFSVTDTKGTTYRLSELLKEKKAVVLNFWFINCGPCKLEFPYLQEAYEAYAEDIEVLAINPIDGTDESISAFAKDYELTFPMMADSNRWESAMKLSAYPTTVVIDRYGTVGFVHNGYITSAEEFEKVFDFFTSDGYTQTTVESLSDINDIK